MNVLFNDIAIAIVFVISGWMLKTYLTHREKMRGLSITKDGLASSDERLARVEQAVERGVQSAWEVDGVRGSESRERAPQRAERLGGGAGRHEGEARRRRDVRDRWEHSTRTRGGGALGRQSRRQGNGGGRPFARSARYQDIAP